MKLQTLDIHGRYASQRKGTIYGHCRPGPDGKIYGGQFTSYKLGDGTDVILSLN